MPVVSSASPDTSTPDALAMTVAISARVSPIPTPKRSVPSS